ncbi:benzoate/H(+) symporter BenE family transporter [Alteromonas pelagimontana]|uniref:Benzoate/H(+) symporter BenE family transporter n=1 Tax=Alteromonas pelagimontana TaxID=1858656 RepID=A0A6M4MAT3_9ALTE|nr:benzoate/H(+) symporter BenE family transporter [Alteromonas pelagimontana]QJR80301.1 benzoate/H(+) symporter BenE family transporter [Alteromonas pelagimontana]
MVSAIRLSHVAAGLTAVVVGYSSAVVLVIEAARTAGATPAMVISWLLILGLGMGATCIFYSCLYRVPVITAWSTPGAAFLIGVVKDYPLNEVVGAFSIAAVFSLVTARSQFLMRKIDAIPPAISAAMLAGILVPICLGVFTDAAEYPLLIVSFLILYIGGGLLFPRYLMLMLLAAAMVASVLVGDIAQLEWSVTVPRLEWVTPHFSLASTIGLALPLFLITMLSQNLPGIAISKSYDFKPDNRAVLTGLALLQLVTGPFGGFTFNFAAITAAICMGDDADPKRSERYKAAIMAGIGYLIFGALASVVVLIFTHMPAVIVHLLAGLALIATLKSSLFKALENSQYRHGAILTFLCSASGLLFAQLSAPVWGLVLGLTVTGLEKLKIRKSESLH